MGSDLKFGSILSLLPDKPGIYEFLDSAGTVIYVGKAKEPEEKGSHHTSQKTSQEKP